MIRSWTDLLEDPDTINDLYINTPSLTDFHLAEVHISADQQALMLRGTFSSFPETTLPDWEEDANRLGVHLWLDNLLEFSLNQWSSDLRVDLEFLYRPGNREIECLATNTDGFRFQARCRQLYIEKVFAYRTV